jgi:hypothetical protein
MNGPDGAVGEISYPRGILQVHTDRRPGLGAFLYVKRFKTRNAGAR